MQKGAPAWIKYTTVGSGCSDWYQLSLKRCDEEMGGERNNCNFDGNSASNCAILFAVVHLRSLDQLHKFILFLLWWWWWFGNDHEDERKSGGSERNCNFTGKLLGFTFTYFLLSSMYLCLFQMWTSFLFISMAIIYLLEVAIGWTVNCRASAIIFRVLEVMAIIN